MPVRTAAPANFFDDDDPSGKRARGMGAGKRWWRFRSAWANVQSRANDHPGRGTDKAPMGKLFTLRAQNTLDIEHLYRCYGGTVARRVRRFVPPCDVEEVVHEVFLKAMERQSAFRGDASPVTWLYHIATNHCLNRIRDHKRRQELLFENRDLPWILPTRVGDTEKHVLLEQVWSKLDETLTTIAMYYFIDGLTHDEIARITGTSRRTVGNRIEALKAQVNALTGGA